MARVFLDTNCLIDAIERRPEKEILTSLKGHTSFISPLSVAIYCYLYKIKVPNKHLSIQLGEFQIVDFSADLLYRAMDGPTVDLEDNIQLHSAAEAECDFFLTMDKKLLKMKFFGKVKLLSTLEEFA